MYLKGVGTNPQDSLSVRQASLENVLIVLSVVLLLIICYFFRFPPLLLLIFGGLYFISSFHLACLLAFLQ